MLVSKQRLWQTNDHTLRNFSVLIVERDEFVPSSIAYMLLGFHTDDRIEMQGCHSGRILFETISLPVVFKQRDQNLFISSDTMGFIPCIML